MRELNLKRGEQPKTLGANIIDSIKNDVIDNIHTRCRNVSSELADDLYSSAEDLGYKLNNVNGLRTWSRQLKNRSRKVIAAEMLQSIIDEYTEKQELLINDYINKQINELKLLPTANENIKQTIDGKFYKLNEIKYEEDDSVMNVNEDGSYDVKSSFSFGADLLITTYNTEDKPVSMKVVNKDLETYKVEKYVAKRLQLKKEVVKQFKLHGYSGNSSGITATIANMITKPIPSGCYFHKNYNFYKWNMVKGQFDIQLRQGYQLGSPLMSDYDIKDEVVIRTDYDGKGICI